MNRMTVCVSVCLACVAATAPRTTPVLAPPGSDSLEARNPVGREVAL